MPDYCDELETRDSALRERRQFAELPGQIARAMKAPGWAAHLKGVDPRTVNSRDALAKLPVLHKSDIAELQKKNPPFGGLATKPAGTFGRLLMSPGPIFEPQAEGADGYGAARACYAAVSCPVNEDCVWTPCHQRKPAASQPTAANAASASASERATGERSLLSSAMTRLLKASRRAR